MSRLSAVLVPLEGWRAEIWVETLQRWYPLMGSPLFANPDDAINWAKENV